MLLFGALILWMSGGRGSAAATGSWAEPLMRWLGFSPEFADVLHRIFRKLGHLTAYALFAVLALRSIRGNRPPTRTLACWALLAAVLLASADETMPSLSSERGASPLDVLLDASGAATALYFVTSWSDRVRRRAEVTTRGADAR